MSFDLEDAIYLAANAHKGQLDKGGEPYILHALRVMLAQKTDDARIAGVLHDVVEDTSVTLDQLRWAGVGDAALEAVRVLTHPKGLSEAEYFAYIGEVKGCDIARVVKIADLFDNLNTDRIQDPTDRDHSRWNKYNRALLMLRFTPTAHEADEARGR